MRCEILERPAFAIAKLTLDRGEEITAESGSMVAMSTGLQVETRASQRGGGGLLRGLKRMFAGENFFLNHYTAERDGASLVLAPRLIGDLVSHRLTGGSIVVQGTSWLASDERISIDATWRGFSSALFSGESMFWVKCSGDGDVLLSSFGSIYEVKVDGEYTVDTGHIVAFEDTLTYEIGKIGDSWLTSFLGGEGIVCHFRGVGKLWCQSHNPPSFGGVLGPLLKPIRR